MRRALLGAAVALAAVGGVAQAAGYRTGTYEQGAQSGFKHTGVRIVIHHASFDVERILMHETCSASGHPSFHDFGGFQEGSSAKLRGTISSRGHFSGIYHNGHGGYTKISGHISGAQLTLTGKEASRYEPSGSTVTYSCQASGMFHPTRTG